MKIYIYFENVSGCFSDHRTHREEKRFLLLDALAGISKSHRGRDFTRTSHRFD